MRGAPAHTVLRNGCLVAYLWPGAGTLQRNTHTIAPVAFAHIETFMPEDEALFARLTAQSPDVDTLLFRLQVEGYEVRQGVVRPHAHLKRF